MFDKPILDKKLLKTSKYRYSVVSGFPYKEYPKEMSKSMTIYQKPEIYSAFLNEVKIFEYLPFISVLTVSIFSENDLKMVIPLITWGGQKATMGIIGMSRYTPVFFSDSESELLDIWNDFLRVIKVKEFVIESVVENSLTDKIISHEQKDWSYTIESDDSAVIDLTKYKDYDEYYSSFSKNLKANLKNRYNRASTDGKTISFCQYTGENFPSDLKDRLLDIYLKRLVTKYEWKHSPFRKTFYSRSEAITQCSCNNPDTVTAVLYIDGNPAAFHISFFDRNAKTMLMPRLAIDESYSRYSPGYLLVNESVKAYYQNDDVRYFDLIRGLERYKLDFGSTIYQLKKYTFKRRKDS